MKIPGFLGGADEQRSNNLSENKLINLYPTTNNDGSATGFYKVDGLKSEGTLNGAPTGAYKASNGRAFYTSGTVLYELTVASGVYTSTSRGAITTAANYEFSDNGIELFMVNGTDAWILTFSTNALLKISVLTATFTVPAATAAEIDATMTKVAHGLTAGAKVALTSTGALPANLSTSVVYFVLADGLTADAFKVGVTLTGATCTISNGDPCEVTSAAHKYLAGTKIRFLTTGGLPASLSVGTIYYVLSDGLTENKFRISLALNGSMEKTTTAGTGVHSFNPAITTIQEAVITCTVNKTTVSLSTCTVSHASPAVVTNVANNLIANQPIFLSSTGSMPSPIDNTGNTTYYVKTILTADTFTISATAGGDVINTTDAGSGTFYLSIPQLGEITTDTAHGYKFCDIVKFSTTGALPTGVLANTEYYVVGGFNISIGFGYGLFLIDKGIPIGTAFKLYSDKVMPDTLEQDKTYYAVSYKAVLGLVFVAISATSGGLPMKSSGSSQSQTGNYNINCMLSNKFSLSLAKNYNPTRVAISGTQSGVHSVFQGASTAYGTHTYTSGGSGFPNGAKLIKYMNGRFIATEPNTQNFYVSEVLDGKTWAAINVQTVDSNPDYVTGIEVTRNELIIFCENSGETFYDSGTTPTPFIRNVTGIFEVGCKAPYSIVNLDNTIFFLGNTDNGNGIVYKMSGLTPQRISNYSIEYAIQQMTDITDARAFSYQKDGHHFYIITFPTGNKTFAYDANTSLWHERAQSTYNLSATPPAMAWNDTLSAISGWSVTDISWNGSLYCAVGTAAGSATTICYTSPDGITWTSRTLPSAAWQGVAWNGVVFAAVSIVTQAATSPDGITWTSRTTSANCIGGITAGTGRFVMVCAGLVTNYSTDNGASWIVGGALPGSGDNWKSVAYDGFLFCAIASNVNGTVCATSTNGVLWTKRELPALAAWQAIEWNGTVFCAIVRSSTQSATSPDGITWTSRTLPENIAWSDIKSAGGVFCISNTTNNNTYISENGITWTAIAIPGAVGNFNRLGTDGERLVTIGLTSPFISAKSSVPVVSAGSYSYTSWPVTKYLNYNNEHLITNDTTTLFSLDSAIYKNGTDPVRIVRSFRAPASDMKRVAHHAIQVDCEVGIGSGTEPMLTLRWSDDSGNTWSAEKKKGLGLVGSHAKRVVFRRLGATRGQPRIYELSNDDNVKITLLYCYLE